MTKPIIQLHKVWKVYKLGDVEVPALRGMDLSINHGEFISVMGPSGSGKSTAVNMIGALDIPTKGEVYLDGKNIAKYTESDLAQLRGNTIGFIFQQFNLIPTLTALENVMLPMMFQQTPLQKRLERANHLLSILGLGDRTNHLPTELSGGQQQRVAIARALANDPQVILADEPTGNLDSQTGRDVIQILKKLHSEDHKTIIMVTHDEKLSHHADRTAYLQDGLVVAAL